MLKEKPLLNVANLCVYFSRKTDGFFAKSDTIKAVDCVSFSIPKGINLGLVGESGSGKTTTAMAAINLIAANEGKSEFEGTDLLSLSPAEMLEYRRKIQIIFQDPFSSLNPRQRAGDIVKEPLNLLHPGKFDNAAQHEKTLEMFKLVGLHKEHMSLFPHQFSGGQRQRIAIARALITSPSLLVCDEPVSALDVAIQAQLLNLLSDLKEQLSLTTLFISHDLRVINYLCDRVIVMYKGKIVEEADKSKLFSAPAHPYTKLLLDSMPNIARRKKHYVAAEIDNSSDTSHQTKTTIKNAEFTVSDNKPIGCSFAEKCDRATRLCLNKTPKLLSNNDRRIACHHPLENPKL